MWPAHLLYWRFSLPLFNFAICTCVLASVDSWADHCLVEDSFRSDPPARLFGILFTVLIFIGSCSSKLLNVAWHTHNLLYIIVHPFSQVVYSRSANNAWDTRSANCGWDTRSANSGWDAPSSNSGWDAWDARSGRVWKGSGTNGGHSKGQGASSASSAWQ